MARAIGSNIFGLPDFAVGFFLTDFSDFLFLVFFEDMIFGLFAYGTLMERLWNADDADFYDLL